MVFDLNGAPFERRNLCQDRASQALARRFVDDIERRFEPDGIKYEALASQRPANPILAPSPVMC